MKNSFKVFIFFLAFCLLPLKLPAQEQPPLGDSKATISMDFQDANLKDVLKIFSIQSGLNFIASEAIQDRKITLFLDKVSIKDAMDKLFKANNLTYELDEEAKIFIVKDWGKPSVETVTKVFYLNYATVSSSSLKEEMSKYISSGSGGGGGKWSSESDVGITKIVRKNLTSSGFVTEDYRTNSLIVTDIPSRMPLIEKLIASLDVAVPQVMLEVEMLDVSKNIVDQLGFDFSNAGSFAMQVVSASRATAFPLSMFAPQFSTKGAFSYGTLSFPTNLKLVFDYLRTRTDTKFLARPRLLTLNNETAEIKIATNESIGVATTTQGTTTTQSSVERSETGVLLRITPQINADLGEITMFIYPEVSEATSGNTFTSAGASFQYRDPEVRSTKSVVRVKDNETVLLGGLIRNEFNEIETKLPILGDLPIIGALFRHKGGTSSSPAKNKERELIVFITPHIIKDKGVELAQAKTMSLTLKGQMPVSPSNRQIAIDASLNSFEKIK